MKLPEEGTLRRVATLRRGLRRRRRHLHRDRRGRRRRAGLPRRRGRLRDGRRAALTRTCSASTSRSSASSATSLLLATALLRGDGARMAGFAPGPGRLRLQRLPHLPGAVRDRRDLPVVRGQRGADDDALRRQRDPHGRLRREARMSDKRESGEAPRGAPAARRKRPRASDRRRRLIQLGSAVAFLAIAGVAVLIVISQSQSDGGDASSVEDVAAVDARAAGHPAERAWFSATRRRRRPWSSSATSSARPASSTPEQIIPEVIAGPVRRGEAKIDFRNYMIIGAQSTAAGAAAVAAGKQGRGWSFVELFYRNQGFENSGYVTDDFLTAIARGGRRSRHRPVERRPQEQGRAARGQPHDQPGVEPRLHRHAVLRGPGAGAAASTRSAPPARQARSSRLLTRRIEPGLHKFHYRALDQVCAIAARIASAIACGVGGQPGMRMSTGSTSSRGPASSALSPSTPRPRAQSPSAATRRGSGIAS